MKSSGGKDKKVRKTGDAIYGCPLKFNTELTQLPIADAVRKRRQSMSRNSQLTQSVNNDAYALQTGDVIYERPP